MAAPAEAGAAAAAAALPPAAAGAPPSDASLERYKASLLGPGAVCTGSGGAGFGAGASACSCAACTRARDPRRVVVEAIRLEVVSRPAIVLAVGSAAAVAALPSAEAPLVVREGAGYRARLRLSVAHGVALGLRLRNAVSNGLGLTLDVDEHALGSYPPGPPLDLDLPPAAWPAGFLARGNYHARTTLTDADGAVHLDARWAFTIARRWPDEADA